MSPPEGSPCTKCAERDALPEPAVRSFGADWLCATCYRIAQWTFNPDVGLGIPGRAAADYAPMLEMFDLQCSKCEATWVGHLLATCPWCMERKIALATRRPPAHRPTGICALLCPVCEWRWEGLVGEACRRPKGQCNGRGSHDLALRLLASKGLA